MPAVCGICPVPCFFRLIKHVVSYLNEVRKAFGMKEINTTSSYAGEHAKYKDYWAPGKSIADDDDDSKSSES